MKLRPGSDEEAAVGERGKPGAAPDGKPVAAAGDHAAAGPSTADATVVLRTRATPLDAGVADVDAGAPDVDASVADMAPPASPDMTVEMRAERRVEVIIPMEMQVMIEVPGAGKVSGATAIRCGTSRPQRSENGVSMSCMS